MDDFFALIGKILTALAAIGVLLKFFGSALLSIFIEKIKSSFVKDIEHEKMKLRKSEFLFEKQFQAASSFSSLLSKYNPQYTVPDMDEHDFFAQIASLADSLARDLRLHLTAHGAIIDLEIKSDINRIIIEAESLAFDGRDERFPTEPTNKSIESAERLWSELNNIETALIREIRSQSIS